VGEQDRSSRARRVGSGRPPAKAGGKESRRHPTGADGPPNRSARPQEAPRPGLARKADEPAIPEGVDTRELHRAVRAELRGLPKDLAEIVASHLLLAGRLIDDDAELAYRHAEAARRRAARLPIVREAAAETAYAAGFYDVALSEFRALRRMTGTHDYLPVMADCERALGRPQNAIKLARESDRHDLEPALRVEMIIVEAGARHDVGQDSEARRILTRALTQLSDGDAALRLPLARLRYALADTLLGAGQESEAREMFARAAQLDTDQETDAQQRLDQLDGLQIDYDHDDADEEPDRPAPGGPGRR
jgi:tetratricopeptide (TPR) repeat protein